MSLPDLGKLLGQAQQIQAKLALLKRDLAARRYEGTAGGGMVVAVVTGELRVLEVKIERPLIESGDRDMIQDLCAAAVNAALANAQQGAQAEMQRLTSSLGLPDLSSLGSLNPFGAGGA